MKLLSLFVRYGDRDYKGAYQALQQLYERFSDVEIHSVLIDTALPNGVEAHIGNQALLMAGDNHRREFSGWDTALARYADQLDEFDLVHVVTSAFQNEYSGFYPLVRREMLDYLIDHPAQVLAHVDAYPDGVRLFGRGFQTWGCSKFLFASPATIRRLGVFVGPFDSTDFFLDEDDGLFAGRAPISSNYAKYLTDWLTGDGLPHGQWHSVFELNSASVEKFRSKALSILDEHSLSMRIRETGATIVDFTWWHANQLKGVPALPPEEILQVAERNRFLFGSEIVEPRVLRQDHPLPAKPAISRLLQHTADTPFGRSPLLESLRAGIEDVEESALDDPLQCAALHLLLGLALDDEQLAWLVAASDKAKQDAPLPITRGLHALWLAKADLKSAMDLDTRAGREALVGWWMSDGRHDKANAGLMLADAYGETSPLLEQDAPLSITRGLHALWLAKADLKSAMDLDTRAGRGALVGWWMSDGRHDKANAGLMLADAYGETAPLLEQDAPLPITRGLHALWLAKADLKSAMDLDTRAGREALVDWWMSDGRHDKANAGLMLADAYGETAPLLEQDAPLPITRGLHALWLAKADLKSAMDLDTRAGREALVGWWMSDGRHDKANDGLVLADAYGETSPLLEQDAPLPITRGLHALWLAKADLKSAMDLDTRAGREALVGWWMSDGRHDKANDGVVLADAYGETSPLLEQDVPLPITRGLHALWLAKADLKSAMDLEMRAGREALVGWWMSDGRHDKANGGLMLADAYGKTSPFLEQDAPLPITRGLQALWLARHDLQGVFDISTPDGRKALVEWFVTYGKDDTAFVLPNAEATSTQFVQENRGRFIFGGVNIVGYARGEFGIGEDVRMATCALETTEFEHCVPGIPLKAGARMRDLTLRGYETGSPLYNVNLICLPHFESLRLLGASRHMILDRRYNIAFWQWELARFPEAMKSALEIVDEIWSISDFAASAMRGATDKSVYSMPLVVELPVMTQKYLRADFGLPEGDFVFLTVLDGFSSIPRKNPQAAVNAFKRAFPGSNGVRLVIKAMNVDVAMPAWKALLDSVTGDSRIKIIAETFSKEKLLALQKVSDCFVSLHRAEGFGRNIAEAMLLGKPVIVSNYSGNTDFTTNSTAFLVEGDMIEIHRGEYPLSDQQVWFDPEVVMASEQMIKCVQDSAARNLKALAGKELVQERYSRNAVGQKYRNRLTQIAFE